jgi:hypothetical protein
MIHKVKREAIVAGKPIPMPTPKLILSLSLYPLLLLPEALDP